MSKNEEMIKFVESSLRLEGMVLSHSEKQTLMDCLTGKKSFDNAVKAALAKHRRLAV